MFGALLPGFHLGGLGALQLGKPYRGRRVAQEDDQPDGSGESDGRRNPEAPFPRADVRGGDHHPLHPRSIVGRHAQVGGDGRHGVGIARHIGSQRPHDIAAEDHHEARADRVRGIPHRHLGRQLRGRNPVGQQTRAGRKSRSLQQAVDDPHDAHEENQRVGELAAVVLSRDPVGDVLAEAEREVGQGAQRKTHGHVPAGVHPVGQNAVGEAREAVDQAVQSEEDAEARLRNAEVGFEAGHGQREVFAHEIEERIADHRGDDRAHLPILEALGLFRGHFEMKVSSFRFQRYDFRRDNLNYSGEIFVSPPEIAPSHARSGRNGMPRPFRYRSSTCQTPPLPNSRSSHSSIQPQRKATSTTV